MIQEAPVFKIWSYASVLKGVGVHKGAEIEPITGHRSHRRTPLLDQIA